MEGEGSLGLGLGLGPYRPSMEAENRSCDGIPASAEIGKCELVDGMDDSQLVGVPVMAAADSVAGGKGATAAVDVEVKAEVKLGENSGGKRKRGRPPKGQAKPPSSRKNEEEDVCFICFDGGSLVLCDRRGCPKAYHPACIKRDEAFFRSRAKWNCGWHICSSCQKAAHYMCYTCTYSLCKTCTKNADYLCVRENKGFCTTCMRTIMLIEKNDQGNKETAQVDFDDKSSWEYLFKVYWVYLKEKLSLTLDELTQAQNPSKAVGTVACNVHHGSNDGKGSISDGPSGKIEANNSKSRRMKEQPKLSNNGVFLSMDGSINDNGNTATGSTEWASKELLEFVAHMRNGDKSVLSQFDVQALLLDYIKINNLRDPRQKGRIICDLQLRSLFGKPFVGHIEMLKLLEFHFPAKEDSWKDVIQGNTVDAFMSQVDGNGNSDNLLMMGKDMKRKTRKKGEERGPQANLDEYAAIDVHNIKLIYLRRNLIESLILDNGTFHDKVVGSIVRIRISCGEQKQDMHRLVQVVGTCKVAVPYKIGEMTADIMLEILNLDKKETISINAISDQEFSENECRRLRQSIKFGLVKRFTVGQVQEKAMALQEVRINDWLETEIMQLNHLRDRASEKGHKKDLRECVEKLELLKSPEERQRRLHEIPEVHADPNMDPIYDSDEGAGEISNNKQDEYVRQRYSGFSKNGMEPSFPQNGDISNDSGSKVGKNLITSDQSRSMSSSFDLDRGAHSRGEGKDVCGPNALENPENPVDSSGSVVGSWNNQAGLRSGAFSGVGSETSVASLSIVSVPSVDDSETDRLWYYRDPNGKIQGPFCMLQLRTWNTNGYFPPDMKIWSINDDEGDSLLVTDVLNGQFNGVSRPQSNVSLSSQEFKGSSDARLHDSDGTRSSSVNTARMDGKQSEGDWKCGDEMARSNGKNKVVKADGWGSQSSNWSMVADNNDERTGPSSQCWDSLKARNCPVPSSTCTDCPPENSLHHVMGNEGQRWNSSPNHGNWSSHGNLMSQTTGGHSHASQSSSQGYSGQSPGENPQPVNYSSNNSKAKLSDSSEQNFGIDIPNLPSLKLKTSNEDWEGQTAKDQQSVLPNVPVQDLNVQNMPRPTPRPSDGNERADTSVQIMPDPLPEPVSEDEKVRGIGNKQYASLNFPVQISGPTWSSASSLVAGSGTQLPEIGEKWGGCSGTRSKPSVEEWDSRFAPAPSLKPHEPPTDHAVTPTSKCDELTHLSLSHPASNWRAIVTEPIEFSTLAEESVSDLLAEVDAMESQGDLASPTSALSCGEELFQDSKTDCFTSLGGLNPPLDLGKNDALSSSGDIQLPPRPTILGTSEANVLDTIKKSGWQSSASTELEVVTKPADVSVIQSVGQSSPQAELEVETKISDVPVIQSGGQSSMDPGEGKVETKPPNVPVIPSGGKSSASTEVEVETKRSDVPEIQSGGQSSIRTERTKPSDVPVIESGGQSSSRAENPRKRSRKEVEVKAKRTDVPDVKSKAKASARSQLPAPSTVSRDVIDTDTAPRAEAKPVDTGSRTMQANMNDAGSRGSTQGMPDMEWGHGRGNTNTNPSRGASDGVRGREIHPKHGGERYMGSKDRTVQSGDSGFGRARQSWSRQSPFGGGGGSGSYSKPPTKGQRLCKFYLNGYCRKGASCDYLHQR